MLLALALPLKGAKHLKIFVFKSPLGDLGASLAVNTYLMTHPSKNFQKTS
jgi:hypothetical protein